MVDRADINAVDDAAWEQAVAREAVIRRLASKASPNRAEFLKACRDLGLKRSRLYELISAYKARPVASSLLAAQVGTPTGSRRLPDEIEAVISGAIEEFYKSLQKPSINALQKEVRRRCSQRGLRPPCWTTLRDRVAAIDPAELTAAREGAKASRQRHHPVPGSYQVERAYEVVQIDHTLVDVIVVDRVHRKPLQRPWLTLAIDVASRMVAGFYLTLEPPSALSVALAIQHLVQPKFDWLESLGIDADWPAEGLPESIHVDNAKEFRSKAMKRGAEEHGISLQYRPIGAPHYGGHIERLIGTMMGAVAGFPISCSAAELVSGRDSAGLPCLFRCGCCCRSRCLSAGALAIDGAGGLPGTPEHAPGSLPRLSRSPEAFPSHVEWPAASLLPQVRRRSDRWGRGGRGPFEGGFRRRCPRSPTPDQRNRQRGHRPSRSTRVCNSHYLGAARSRRGGPAGPRALVR